MSKAEVIAWHTFIYEVPWLTSADRNILRMACRLKVATESAVKINLGHYSQFSRLLSKLGCTPCDRTRVSVPDDDTETAEERYFNS
jgi:hypothetical protein